MEVERVCASSGLKVQELKDKLASLGLSTAGTKPVLQERLDNYMTGTESEMTTGNNANEGETSVESFNRGEPDMAADESSLSGQSERPNSDPILLISQENEPLDVSSTLLSVCEDIKFLKSEFESFKDKHSNSNLPADVTKPVASKTKKEKTLKKQIVVLNAKLGEKTARIEELELERNSLLRTIRLLSLQCEACSEPVTVERPSVSKTVTVDSSNPGPKPTKCKRKSKTGTTQRNNGAGGKQPSLVESTTNSDPGTTVLLGDSMIKNIPGWNVGKELGRRFVVKPFPGARVRDMKHYIQPTLDQKPDEIVLHCGTNDLRDMEPKAIAEGLVDIARSVEASSSIKVTVSELVTRADPSLDAKAQSTNKRLRKFCNQNGWGYISHRNISVDNLNRGGLHLAAGGNRILLANFINYFKSD